MDIQIQKKLEELKELIIKKADECQQDPKKPQVVFVMVYSELTTVSETEKDETVKADTAASLIGKHCDITAVLQSVDEDDKDFNSVFRSIQRNPFHKLMEDLASINAGRTKGPLG